MPAKIRLLATSSANCIVEYQHSVWSQYFDIEPWNPGIQQPGDVLITDFMDSTDYTQFDIPVIVDHLWDSAVDQISEIQGNQMILRAPDWIWMHEHWLGRHNHYYTPRLSSDPTKFFLMPMNLQRAHRNALLQAMQPYLDDSVWSYVYQGRLLPNDVFVKHFNSAGTANDRYYLPEWYQDTCFSMVSETAVDTDLMGWPLRPSQVFVSEKTFKPLAYQHPFVIYGTAGTLAYLKSRGFAVFESDIDVSYDLVRNSTARLQAIAAQIHTLYEQFQQQGSVLQTTVVQQQVTHNHALFWNSSLVNQLFVDQIVNVIENFAESQ